MEVKEKDNPIYLNQGVVAIHYKKNRINNIHNLLKRDEVTTTFSSIGNQITSPKYKYTSLKSLNKSNSSGNLYNNNSSLYLNSSSMSNNSNVNPSFFNKLNSSKDSSSQDLSDYYRFISYNEIKRGLVDFSDIKNNTKRYPFIGDFFANVKITKNKDDEYIPLVKEYQNKGYHMFYDDKEKEIFKKYRLKDLDRYKQKKLTVKEMMEKMRKLSQKNIEKFRDRELKRYRQVQINLDAVIDKSLEKCSDQVRDYFIMMDNCTQFVNKLRIIFFFYSFKFLKSVYYNEVNKYFL